MNKTELLQRLHLHFQYYRVVVLAPDMLDREFYRDIMDLVLRRLGFDAAIIHQVS